MGQKSSTHSKWSYGYVVQKIPPHPSLCLSLIGLSFQGESIPHSFPNRYSLVNNGITAQRFTFRWKKRYSIKGEKAKWSERGSEYPLPSPCSSFENSLFTTPLPLLPPDSVF
uniref:Uncharacterized protein n=1 Tax=Cacopsylla melanoneura TaxID=428564 RepID=A0A8D9E587_9HEMI